MRGYPDAVGRALTFVVLLAAVGTATGCAELESGRVGAAELAEADAPQPAPEKAKRVPRKWKGAHAVRYERAYRLCDAFSVEEIAEQHDAPARPKPAARALARDVYQKPYRQAAFHGCLDAFLGRASGVG